MSVLVMEFLLGSYGHVADQRLDQGVVDFSLHTGFLGVVAERRRFWANHHVQGAILVVAAHLS